MDDMSGTGTATGETTGGAGERDGRSREAGLAQCLRLLGDDTRLRIFSLLTKAELCVCEIEDILGLSQSLVSNHLAALRRAGLVESRRDEEDARWVFYRADRAAAAALRERLAALLNVQPAVGNRRRAEQVCRLKEP
jgi:ArsR family transcriptional regulator, arsenate/arsenite/antimonite-responsive transcriptional repressor